MTYRDVPQNLRLLAQLVTLGGTAIVGLSLALTPHAVDPKLTVIEQTANADVWAYFLVGFGTFGFICESVQAARGTKNPVLFWTVSVCHGVLFGAMVGYSLAALVSVFMRTPWNFGVPTVGLMVAVWHYIYIRRRAHEPRTVR